MDGGNKTEVDGKSWDMLDISHSTRLERRHEDMRVLSVEQCLDFLCGLYGIHQPCEQPIDTLKVMDGTCWI